jgi:hypothetical protein
MSVFTQLQFAGFTSFKFNFKLSFVKEPTTRGDWAALRAEKTLCYLQQAVNPNGSLTYFYLSQVQKSINSKLEREIDSLPLLGFDPATFSTQTLL